ncbi:RmlC-like cupin domain-containing protein [Clohesyomyces aquaticus]|uniref:RmlC-like cupin domain-containing protein n=1 Tax=Clohesyomyces aquaticus TaxID=1231657 RepID=A0A1Y1ZT83_9PLEO|nr:RmlC-like cupin domain-containing protein [Clohesyomyces aquaticus]
MSPLSLITSLLTLFISTTLAVDKTANPELNAKIKLLTTEKDKHNLINKDEDWMFDFTAQPNYTFKPGCVVNANAATFPAMTGYGMTMAMLNLGPCAMLPPHFHPRATNLVVAVSGNTTTYMYGENGVGTVKTQLTPGKMTIFPRGSAHTMQNNGCEDAILISALDSEDAGTLNMVNGPVLNFPEDIMRAAFGDDDLDIGAMGKRIPDVGTGSVMGSAECRKRCGSSDAKTPKRGDKFTA